LVPFGNTEHSSPHTSLAIGTHIPPPHEGGVPSGRRWAPNDVGVLDGRQAVRNGYHRPPFHRVLGEGRGRQFQLDRGVPGLSNGKGGFDGPRGHRCWLDILHRWRSTRDPPFPSGVGWRTGGCIGLFKKNGSLRRFGVQALLFHFWGSLRFVRGFDSTKPSDLRNKEKQKAESFGRNANPWCVWRTFNACWTIISLWRSRALVASSSSNTRGSLMMKARPSTRQKKYVETTQ